MEEPRQLFVPHGVSTIEKRVMSFLDARTVCRAEATCSSAFESIATYCPQDAIRAYSRRQWKSHAVHPAMKSEWASIVGQRFCLAIPESETKGGSSTLMPVVVSKTFGRSLAVRSLDAVSGPELVIHPHHFFDKRRVRFNPDIFCWHRNYRLLRRRRLFWEKARRIHTEKKSRTTGLRSKMATLRRIFTSHRRIAFVGTAIAIIAVSKDRNVGILLVSLILGFFLATLFLVATTAKTRR